MLYNAGFERLWIRYGKESIHRQRISESSYSEFNKPCSSELLKMKSEGITVVGAPYLSNWSS